MHLLVFPRFKKRCILNLKMCILCVYTYTHSVICQILYFIKMLEEFIYINPYMFQGDR